MKFLKKLQLFTLLYAAFPALSQVYSLQQTLRAAISGNSSLRLSKNYLGLAEADLITAGLRPNLILNNQSLQLVDPAYFPGNSAWTDGRNRQVWWQLTKPLLLPGVRQARLDYASKNLQLQEQLVRKDEERILLEVSNKWISAFISQKRKAQLQLAKTVSDSLYEKAAGNQPSDFYSELFKGHVEIELRSVEENYENEIEDLMLLVGIKDRLQPDTSAASWRFLTSLGDSILTVSETNRPEVLSLVYLRDAAAANVRMQKSLAWPTPELGFIYNPQNTIPYFGTFGTIHIPLFSRNQGEIRKAGLQMQIAEENMNYRLLQIKNELTRALNQCKRAKSDHNDYKLLLSKATVFLKTAKDGYRNKSVPAGEYLEAQKNWLEIGRLCLHAEETSLRCHVQLLYVTGALSSVRSFKAKD